ncbi:MAG TPA: hypothetical protein DCP90_01840 [Clostridiales bacterium]|nr:MAG: hypothetical protein A2Y22_03350 [Clostridiales bacterium GWD2_32_59]HAN09335.1 hypothetical protein [Clostridiales bacterium]
MGEIKLSEYIELSEKSWIIESESNAKKIIDFLNEEMKTDLYVKYNKNNPRELFKSLKVWLLVYYKDLLMSALEHSNIQIETYHKEMLNSLVLVITREKSNVNVIIDALIKGEVIKSVSKADNGNFIIDSHLFGTITFSKASEKFNEEKIKTFLQKEYIEERCHESALFLIENSKEYHAITSICMKDLGQKYYHSFCIDNSENVIDFTGNLVMPKKYFYNIYSVEELNSVSYEEYLKYKEDSTRYDESKTLMPLLRMAVYRKEEQLKNNS